MLPPRSLPCRNRDAWCILTASTETTMLEGWNITYRTRIPGTAGTELDFR